MFVVHAKFHHEITLVEVVAKITKSELQNTFESNIFKVSILFFLQCLPPMSFHDEILQAQQTFLKVCHKFFLEFFEMFSYFIYFTVHSRSI